MKHRLSNGVVIETRIVPPFAQAQLASRYPDPDPPTRLVTSEKTGHTEELPLDEESSEWLDWARERREIRRQFSDELMELALDYGIVRWRNAPSRKWWQWWSWQSNPPGNWQADSVLQRFDLLTSESPRVNYLRTEVVCTPGDLTTVLNAVLGTPVTEGEVEAATASFPDAGVAETTG